MLISIAKALELLKQGELVAVPTDTVYGLAADLHRMEAVEKLYRWKERPREKPLIAIFENLQQIRPWIREFPPQFEALSRRFWPGPLTILLPVHPSAIPASIRANGNTLGFRIPNHPVLLALLRQFGPVVAPSANLSGKPTAISQAHVEQDFGTEFPILEGGPLPKGIESTVIQFDGSQWEVTRLGAILPSALEKVLGYLPKNPSPPKRLEHAKSHTRFYLGTDAYRGAIPVVLGFKNRTYEGAKQVIYLGDLSQPEPEIMASQIHTLLREIEQSGTPAVWVDMDFPADGFFALVRQVLIKKSLVQ